ncbi:MAG: HAMP domain-containing sensor histidine kinase [Oleiphilaceae bacterium]|nr:HAMP domain-containing sensor histidine kinase [Oleiphilaceae bacterium]
MKAVLRLNLIVSGVFLAALLVALYFMLQQASRDIHREVTAGVTASWEMISVASEDPDMLEVLLATDARHVRLEMVEDIQELAFGMAPRQLNPERGVPSWLSRLVPDLDQLTRVQQLRYLPDGRAIRLTADPSDELQEVWESFLQIVGLFISGALLSNVAIYFGVRQGTRPIAHFVWALDSIQRGHYRARLKKYSIGELNDLAEHFNNMAQAIENTERENRKLTRTLMEVRETERTHLARELHDDLGQYLTGMQAQAYLISEESGQPELVKQVAGQLSDNCESMHKSFRRLVRDLHPAMLEQMGLHGAIQTLVTNWSEKNRIGIRLNLPTTDPKLTMDNNAHIYRIVQEALNNVARHAGAATVEVTASHNGKDYRLSVCDDGRGLGAKDAPGLGVRSMRERAAFLGATLGLLNRAEAGCCIELKMPLSRPTQPDPGSLAG